MNSTVLALLSRLRHCRLEAVLVIGMTLTAVTAPSADGALSPLRTEPEAQAPAVVPAAPPKPAEPPAVFDCGEPVPGRAINSPFGLRRMPWERHGRLHEGVDISAPVGLPVLAVADGVVTRAGNSAGYGRFVEVKHAEGLVSFYAHLGRIDPRARPGAVVLSGRAIGRIGSSGTSTGPHLHFEIRRNDRPLNPVAFIGREFVKAEDLPLKTAARYSRRVRVAQVSFIPQSKRVQMEAPRKLAKEARPRASLQVTPRTAGDAAVDASAAVPGEVATTAPPPVLVIG